MLLCRVLLSEQDTGIYDRMTGVRVEEGGQWGQKVSSSNFLIQICDNNASFLCLYEFIV